MCIGGKLSEGRLTVLVTASMVGEKLPLLVVGMSANQDISKTLKNCHYHYVGSVVEWLKRRAYDQHGLGSKPTRAILLRPWERHFTEFSPAWWSWQAALD